MTTPIRRVLLVAHDRGGVNLLTPLLAHWAAHEPRIEAAFLGSPMVEYELRNFLPKTGRAGNGRSGNRDLAAILRGARWDVVLTGTSLSSDLEKSAWRLARDLSIPSAAICDMWTEYDRRFRRDAELVLPDALLVLDDRMAEEARDALGSAARITVVGSPHFATLIATPPAARMARTKVRFISEPAAAIFPDAGIHEFSIAETIIAALDRLGQASTLVLRPHPQDDSEAWRRFVYGYRDQGVRLDDEPSWACPRSTRLAIGLSSMMLLELAMAGISVASFHPEGSNEAYYCLPEKDFRIAVLRSQRDLEAWLEAPPLPQVSREFVALHEAAITRITELILAGRLVT